MSRYKLLEHGLLITVDEQRRVIEDGAILIEADKILAVGTVADLRRSYVDQISSAETIDCTDQMLIPGLIDVHSHAGHSLLTILGLATPSNWMPMMTEIYHHNTDDEFWYDDGRLAALTRLKYGVTTGLSMLTNCQRSDNINIGIGHSNGYAEVGIREIIAVGPQLGPYPAVVHNVDAQGRKQRAEYSLEELFDRAEQMIAKLNHSHNDLIRAFISTLVLVNSVNRSSATTPDVAIKLDDQDRYIMRSVREIARRQQTRIHTEAFGGMIRMVADEPYAMLGEDVHIQHCRGISLDEVKILAESGTSVSSTPSAGQLINRCPVPELMMMGCNVAISSDGTAPSATFDLIRVAQDMQMIHRGYLHDMYYFPVGKLLEMITIDAAKAIGMENEIGSISVGKKADIAFIELNKPHLTPRLMCLRKWFMMGTGQDIDHVMVDGEFVLRNRQACNVDEKQILDRAHAQAERTIRRAGMEKFLEPCDTFWRSLRVYCHENRFVDLGWK